MSTPLFIILIGTLITLFICIFKVNRLISIMNFNEANMLKIIDHCQEVILFNNRLITDNHKLGKALNVLIKDIDTNVNNNSKNISFIKQNMIRRKYPIEEENN